MGFPGGILVKNPPANAGGMGDSGSMIPGSERSPGVGNGNPLQYSYLENPMDRGAWRGYTPWGHKESDMTERLSEEKRLNKIPKQGINVTYEGRRRPPVLPKERRH